ncbi:Engulfment and cell motility protein 1 [Heterocephalus glaber]|uniref:Engulfment and cell motility protein 1 n=1 Tax=Heterocephalus glaber TaxID=10181 RepID=G5B3W0_HETGA|nr:Engulfment and cell motility protein 1 [Heterocephalus glaber]
MRALTTKPSSLDQFKSKLQNLSYTEILKIRQSERMNQEDFQSRPILELKEKIQPEILELIKQQRLNRLVEGTCFRKLNARRRQDKFWYCRLSPNHKVLHYGDLEENPQGEVPHDSLQDKLASGNGTTGALSCFFIDIQAFNDVITFVFFYELQCQWQISKPW